MASCNAFGQGLNVVQTQTPGVIPNLTNGGKVGWYPASGTVTTSTNWFGNTLPVAPPSVGLTTTGCSSSTLTPSDFFTSTLILFDQVGDAVYSSTASLQAPSSGAYCPQLLSNPVLNGPAGAVAFMLLGCQSSSLPCTAPVILTVGALQYGPTGYGPFDSTLAIPTSFRVPAVPATAPVAPPANTSGILVSNVNLELGSSTFLTNVPVVTGTYTRITGDNGKSTVIQAGPGFPSAIPALGEPAGFPSASTSGTVGNSVTVALGLYDGCGVATGTGNVVTLGPPHTFPPFVAGNQAITVFNPGIPQAQASWAPNTQYWGSSIACAGQRVAVAANSNSSIYILRATAVGVTSATQPNWSSAAVCGASIVVGSTCVDGSEKWIIEAIWGARSPGGTYTVGSRTTGSVWDLNNQTIWALYTITGASCTASGSSNSTLFGTGKILGDVVPDNQCNWINIGQSYLINPGFGVFSASCAANQTGGTWSKQCSGGGSTATNGGYLASLRANSSSAQYNWSGCTNVSSATSSGQIMGTCDANQTMKTSLVAITGTGAFAPASPTPFGTACPAFLSGCVGNSKDLFVQTVWATPNGPGVPMPESAVASGWLGGTAVTGSAPSNPPPNAVGYLVYASNANNDGNSANNAIQMPDGIQLTCSAYVTSLPYGRLCAPGSTWQINTIQTGTGRVPTHNASGMLISLGGSPLLPAWPGGCYGVQISNLFLEAAPPALTAAPFTWGIFNQSCQESTRPDALTVSDALAGAVYYFGANAQNSWLGYVHTIGNQSDYYIGYLVEDLASFHDISEFSYGPNQGTQWLGRSCVYVMQNLASSSRLGTGGEVNNYHCEAALEQLTVSNIPVIARNNWGKKDPQPPNSPGRAPWFAAHLDQYSQSVDLSEIWAGSTSGSSNIQDDVCDAVNPATTVAPTATAHYLRDADASGNATCGQFVLNTDPGARFSVSTTSTEYFTNSFPGPNNVAFLANSSSAVGVVVPQAISTSHVDYTVQTADNTAHNYDFGFINSLGIVICETGKQQGSSLFPSTGTRSANWSKPCYLSPGKYYLAMTSDCPSACAVIQGGLNSPLTQTFYNGSISVTTAGTLNNLSTIPTDALTTTSIPSLWVH